MTICSRSPELRVLEPRVHELDLSLAFRVLPGKRDRALAGFGGRGARAPPPHEWQAPPVTTHQLVLIALSPPTTAP